MLFDEVGYELIEALLATDQVQLLCEEIDQLTLRPLQAGIRRINSLSNQVAKLAGSAGLQSLAERYLPGPAELVRAIYFDKSSGQNWFVTWHQDRTVAVSERFVADDWGQWSVKDGVWHVQPPIGVLEQMVTIRIHLDNTSKTNGCLKVIPGSHKSGLLPSNEIGRIIKPDNVVYCELSQGGAIIMRPHLLHASGKSSSPGRRRVLHFEYSSYRLPQTITWSP